MLAFIGAVVVAYLALVLVPFSWLLVAFTFWIIWKMLTTLTPVKFVLRVLVVAVVVYILLEWVLPFTVIIV